MSCTVVVWYLNPIPSIDNASACWVEERRLSVKAEDIDWHMSCTVVVWSLNSTLSINNASACWVDGKRLRINNAHAVKSAWIKYVISFFHCFICSYTCHRCTLHARNVVSGFPRSGNKFFRSRYFGILANVQRFYSIFSKYMIFFPVNNFF